MLDAYEKGLCRKIAAMFSIAGKKGIPVLLFTRIWFSSAACYGLLHDDFFSIAQSPLYQLNSILLEVPELSEHIGTEYNNEELMYWAGYTLTYWMFFDRISWNELVQKYDYVLFLRNYDYLHTLSPESTIALAKNEYSRLLLAKLEAFGTRD